MQSYSHTVIQSCSHTAIQSCSHTAIQSYTEGTNVFKYIPRLCDRLEWESGLTCGSVAARLLGLQVRIPPGTRIFVSFLCVCVCVCVVPASRLSLVQRSPTECGVSECDREASIMRPCPLGAVVPWGQYDLIAY